MKFIKVHPYWPPIFLMVLIFIESSIPMDGGPDNIEFLTSLDPKLQNLLHIPLYGTLCFLWIRFFCASKTPTFKKIIYSLMLTVGYGIIDEFHQSFVPGRYGGLLDIYLNMAGAVSGAAVYWYGKRRTHV